MIACAPGYMTAYNEYGGETKRGDVPGRQRTEELAKWIDDDCRKNPSDRFYGATAALIRKFRNVSSPCSTFANGLTCPVVPVSGV